MLPIIEPRSSVTEPSSHIVTRSPPRSPAHRLIRCKALPNCGRVAKNSTNFIRRISRVSPNGARHEILYNAHPSGHEPNLAIPELAYWYLYFPNRFYSSTLTMSSNIAAHDPVADEAPRSWCNDGTAFFRPLASCPACSIDGMSPARVVRRTSCTSLRSKRRGAVRCRAVVPHDEVVGPPGVGVDELALGGVLGQVVQEHARFRDRPAEDGVGMRGEEQ
jgi:hypothetical protein